MNGLESVGWLESTLVFSGSGSSLELIRDDSQPLALDGFAPVAASDLDGIYRATALFEDGLALPIVDGRGIDIGFEDGDWVVSAGCGAFEGSFRPEERPDIEARVEELLPPLIGRIEREGFSCSGYPWDRRVHVQVRSVLNLMTGVESIGVVGDTLVLSSGSATIELEEQEPVVAIPEDLFGRYAPVSLSVNGESLSFGHDFRLFIEASPEFVSSGLPVSELPLTWFADYRGCSTELTGDLTLHEMGWWQATATRWDYAHCNDKSQSLELEIVELMRDLRSVSLDDETLTLSSEIFTLELFRRGRELQQPGAG